MNKKVYCLTDVNNPKIIYVGQSVNAKDRLANNKIKFKRDFSYQILESGIDNKQDAIFWEDYWMGQMQSWGFTLLNQRLYNKAPNFNKRHSNEIKRKIGLKSKQRDYSLMFERNKKISNHHKGIKRTKECKDNISKAHLSKIKHHNSKCLIIDGIEYTGANKAGRLLGIKGATIAYRCGSKNFINYNWLE